MRAELNREGEHSVEFHKRRSAEEYQAASTALAPAVKMKHLALALEHSVRAFECSESLGPEEDDNTLREAKQMLRQALPDDYEHVLKFTDWG